MLTEWMFVGLGILGGIITGLIPGIHVNLVATLVLSLGIGNGIIPLLLGVALTHSFLDVIPAVLLGAPNSDTALGVLPGHRYVLKGWGYMAIKLTLLGSYFGLLVAVLFIPLWMLFIRVYPFLVHIMGYLLLIVSALMILRDRKKLWSITVYALSGALGYCLLNKALVINPLFPLFSGLFGVSTLLYSLRTTTSIPAQIITKEIKTKLGVTIKAVLSGNFSGFLTSMLPGLGSAQAAIIALQITRKLGDHGFLILLGTINTVNFSLSLLTWLLLDKARNGAVVAMQSVAEVSPLLITRLFVYAVIIGSICVPLCLVFARLGIKVVDKLSYKALTISVITLITALVFFLTGFRGLYILLLASSLGFIPAITKCSRTHAMGCLLFPVALYFMG